MKDRHEPFLKSEEMELLFEDTRCRKYLEQIDLTRNFWQVRNKFQNDFGGRQRQGNQGRLMSILWKTEKEPTLPTALAPPREKGRVLMKRGLLVW